MSGYVGPARLWTGTPGAPAIRNAWGAFLNADMTVVQEFIGGYVAVPIGGLTTYTLTVNNAAADQSRPSMIDFTGALAATCTVDIPNVQRWGWVRNSTTGGRNVELNAGGGGNAVIPPVNVWMLYWCDGSGGVGVPGIGVGGLYATGGLTVTSGGAAITGAVTMSSTLAVTGAVTMGSTLVVNGGVTGNAGATFAGLVTAEDFFATDDVSVNGSLSVAGGAGINGGLTIGSGGMNVVGNTTIASGVLAISGQTSTSVSNAGQFGQFGYTAGVSGGTNYSLSCISAVLASVFFATSDRRAKTDVEEISADAAWRWVSGGRPVTFTIDGAPGAGFIAQEEVAAGRGASVSVMVDDRPEFAESDGIAPPGHRLIKNYEMEIAYLSAALKDVRYRLVLLESK